MSALVWFSDRVLEVYLDDALYGCCGPDLTVGRCISWPLNFQLTDGDSTTTRTGVLEHAVDGVGLSFQIGAAVLYVPDTGARCGEATLTGRAQYLDHGYIPQDWPHTTGIVRWIRSADGSFHHRWTSSDSQRVRLGAATRVMLDIVD